MSSREFIKELIQKKKDEANESIEVTADQLWKYSGKIEEDSVSYKLLKHNAKKQSSWCYSFRPPKKSKKEYFKLYWQKYKGQRKKKL